MKGNVVKIPNCGYEVIFGEHATTFEYVKRKKWLRSQEFIDIICAWCIFLKVKNKFHFVIGFIWVHKSKMLNALKGNYFA